MFFPNILTSPFAWWCCHEESVEQLSKGTLALKGMGSWFVSQRISFFAGGNTFEKACSGEPASLFGENCFIFFPTIEVH